MPSSSNTSSASHGTHAEPGVTTMATSSRPPRTAVASRANAARKGCSSRGASRPRIRGTIAAAAATRTLLTADGNRRPRNGGPAPASRIANRPPVAGATEVLGSDGITSTSTVERCVTSRRTRLTVETRRTASPMSSAANPNSSNCPAIHATASVHPAQAASATATSTKRLATLPACGQPPCGAPTCRSGPASRPARRGPGSGRRHLRAVRKLRRRRDRRAPESVALRDPLGDRLQVALPRGPPPGEQRDDPDEHRPPHERGERVEAIGIGVQCGRDEVLPGRQAGAGRAGARQPALEPVDPDVCRSSLPARTSVSAPRVVARNRFTGSRAADSHSTACSSIDIARSGSRSARSSLSVRAIRPRAARRSARRAKARRAPRPCRR